MSTNESEYFGTEEVIKRDPADHFEHEWTAARADMPRVNVLVAGPTGAGKSTLVNAILRKPVAKTGKGEPVTRDITAWSVEGVPITVYDTPGLELDQKIRDVAKRTVKFLKQQRKRPVDEHIHVFWYCSLAPGSRFLEAEADFIKEVSEYVDGIVVLTQCLGPEDEEAKHFRAEVLALLDKHGAQVSAGSPIMTLAHEKRVGGQAIEAFGLTELVNATYELLPEGVKRAFSNAQGVDLQLKRREARKVVAQHVGLAAGIGAVPIPIPDAGPLLALQGAMLARITVAMGVEFDESTRRFLIKGVLGSGALVQIGRQAASMLLKAIPGVGSAINATVAGALTAALGEAYIALCSEFLRRFAAGKDMPDVEMLDFLMNEFKVNYKRQAR